MRQSMMDGRGRAAQAAAQTASVLAAIGLTVGCATTSPTLAANRLSTTADCRGARHLVVSNPLGRDLDVYNGRDILGIARPGVTELDVVQRVVGFYAYYAGTREAVYVPTEPQKSLVRVELACGAAKESDGA